MICIIPYICLKLWWSKKDRPPNITAYNRLILRWPHANVKEEQASHTGLIIRWSYANAKEKISRKTSLHTMVLYFNDGMQPSRKSMSLNWLPYHYLTRAYLPSQMSRNLFALENPWKFPQCLSRWGLIADTFLTLDLGPWFFACNLPMIQLTLGDPFWLHTLPL